MLECVVNISEGRRREVIDSIAHAAGEALLDVHGDVDHNRSVLTLLGTEAPRAVARRAIELIDLRRHMGVHPRMGVVDVVPFVALEGSNHQDALAARDDFARWVGNELRIPAFLYSEDGPTLPHLRREAFRSLHPDFGPSMPHPTAGAISVGARNLLVAYNIWLAEPDMNLARSIATQLRGPSVRALAIKVGEFAQVSMNLIDPQHVGPQEVYDIVASQAEIRNAELVGLIPKSVLSNIDPTRWEELDVGPERTIEARQPRTNSRRNQN